MSRPPRLPVPLADCQACTMPIRFVRLNTGKAMPVNPQPGATGNVAARVLNRSLVGFVISAERQPGPSDLRFVPHFATCEERDRAKGDQTEEREHAPPADEPLFT